MPVWHCPNCGTPQAETSRCWVCRRSSTTCSTCRHFRPSLAAQIGFCGLDSRRRPLTGRELRGCWEAAPARAAEGADSLGPPALATDMNLDATDPAVRLRGFVPVLLRRPTGSALGAGSESPPSESRHLRILPTLAEPGPIPADRSTLFGELES